jgi:hypothetical protein
VRLVENNSPPLSDSPSCSLAVRRPSAKPASSLWLMAAHSFAPMAAIPIPISTSNHTKPTPWSCACSPMRTRMSSTSSVTCTHSLRSNTSILPTRVSLAINALERGMQLGLLTRWQEIVVNNFAIYSNWKSSLFRKWRINYIVIQKALNLKQANGWQKPLPLMKRSIIWLATLSRLPNYSS